MLVLNYLCLSGACVTVLYNAGKNLTEIGKRTVVRKMTTLKRYRIFTNHF